MNNATNTAITTAQILNLPVGTIFPFAGDAGSVGTLRNTGWLLCDGKAVLKAEFPELDKVMKDACGNSSTEFNLPDLQGVFLRGLDGDKNRDPDSIARTAQAGGAVIGNKVLSRQEDELRKHKHTFPDRAFHEHVYATTNGGGYHFPRIMPQGGETSETQGNETRPKNVAVNYIIFAGIPVKLS